MSQPDSSSSVSSVQPVDLVELEERLGELLNNYRDALRVVARLPKFGRATTSISRQYGSHEPELSRRKHRRWVIRPFVRLFVELHIRRRLKIIARLLDIEAISLNDSDERTEQLKSFAERLETLRGKLVGWGRVSGFLTRAPLLSVLIPFAAAIVLQISGVDFSNPSGLGRSLAMLGQEGKWDFILRLLALIGSLLIYVYAILATLVIGIGFRGKRAIFAGGITVADNSEWNPFVKESEIWDDLPRTNVYETENRLFATLRVSKPKEFPLELVAIVKPYFCLVVAILISIDAILTWKRGGGVPSIWGFVGLFTFWYMTIIFFWAGLKNYQERVKTKNI